jgi:hypothetical protein
VNCYSCQLPAVVQWQRRVAEDSVAAVYSCTAHAITSTLAACTHEVSCTGLVKDGTCGCTPEPAGDSVFPGPGETHALPPGW